MRASTLVSITVLLLVCSSVPCVHAALFQAPLKYSFNATSNTMALGAFDLDAHRDIVVSADASVQVLWNDGDGGYALEYEWSLEIDPQSLTVGDFNNDGYDDFAAAASAEYGEGYYDAYFKVFINNRAHGFTTSYMPDSRYVLVSHAVDVDGDGFDDLLARFSNVWKKLRAYSSNGDGTFTTATDIDLVANPRSIASADMDNDGDQDLLVVSVEEDLDIYLNDGAGNFGTPTTYDAGLGDILIDDLDGDGDKDIVVPRSRVYAVEVLANDGHAAFFPVGQFGVVGVGDRIRSMDAADVDGDGSRDLMVTGGGEIITLFNNGNLSFAQTRITSSLGGAVAIAGEDADGDGDQDLLVLQRRTVLVERNDGTGIFAPPPTFPVGSVPWALSAENMNGDGADDLVVLERWRNSVGVLVANGDGGFSPVTHYAIGCSDPSSMDTGDLNGDGYIDAVVGCDDYVSVLLGCGDATFATSLNYEAGDWTSDVAIGDITGDGRRDIVVTSFQGSWIAIFPNMGDDTFGSPDRTTLAERPMHVALGDFDGDGDTDAAVSQYPGNTVVILTNDGSGTLVPGPTIPHVAPFDMVAVDIDADLDLDLASCTLSSFTAILNNGDGTFTTATNYDMSEATGSAPARIAFADVDGDTDVDFVVSDYHESEVVVLINDGVGGFTWTLKYAPGTEPQDVCAGDFNGDGLVDLASALKGNRVAILMNSGTEQSGARQVFVDIKPGSCPNPLNTTIPRGRGYHGGVVHVAVLGTNELDVIDIDVATVTLEGVAPLRHRYRDIGAPPRESLECACPEIERDGYSDLVLAFRRVDLARALYDTPRGVAELELNASLRDGTLIAGTDCVKVVPKKGNDGPWLGSEDGPATTSLGHASPNPFNPVTIIPYTLSDGGHVTLEVFDVTGKRIAILVNREQPPGQHRSTWLATGTASGVYFYRLQTGSFTQTRKLVLLK